MPQNIITIAKAINVSNISRVMVIIPHFSYTFGHRGNKLVTNRYLLRSTAPRTAYVTSYILGEKMRAMSLLTCVHRGCYSNRCYNMDGVGIQVSHYDPSQHIKDKKSGLHNMCTNASDHFDGIFLH